jgi:hypothetical protein
MSNDFLKTHIKHIRLSRKSQSKLKILRFQDTLSEVQRNFYTFELNNNQDLNKRWVLFQQFLSFCEFKRFVTLAIYLKQRKSITDVEEIIIKQIKIYIFYKENSGSEFQSIPFDQENIL